MHGKMMLCSAAALLIVGSEHIAAQEQPATPLATGRIFGRVTDAVTKQPIEGATVRLTDVAGMVRLTDSRGSFTFSGIPRAVHQVVIEHVGYGTGSHLVNVPGGETVLFEAELQTHAIALDSLVIVAHVRATQLQRAGFYDRARRGFGKFFSGDEISTATLREAIYTVPGFDFMQSSRGTARQLMVRTFRGTLCVPEIYLDGMRQSHANGEVESVVGGVDIEAMEVYRGNSTPAEFTHGVGFAPCGAVVLWRRK
jgi:hypothetical protein